ncbi:M13 family metallopeptidase [Dyella koreensis]|uniref:M13 family metallopeptidase n=1 Tax=Dyella koreensis TaxID=311235 RepID=UPI00361AF355
MRPLLLAAAIAFAPMIWCQEIASPASPEGLASSISAAADSAHAFDFSELDSTISACRDLNGFVNAKWFATHPIPPDQSHWSVGTALAERSLAIQRNIVESAAANAGRVTASSIEQKIGWLYRSGMDQAARDKAGFDPIKPLLADIASLRVRSDISGYIRAHYLEGGMIFLFGANADAKDASRQIAVAQQGGLGLPTPAYYAEDRYTDLRRAYSEHIARTLALTGITTADAEEQASDVLALETALARASLTPLQLRDPTRQYHFVTVLEASKITPHFDWSAFFTAQHATVNQGFSIAQPGFFAQFDHLLATAPMKQWRAYFRFHLIETASPYLSTAFEDNHFDFRGRVLAGQPQQQPRWRRMLDNINALMGMALGKLYIQQNFSPDTKQQAEQLATEIGAALRQHIEQADWMSAVTKKKALDKWSKVLLKIGYPDDAHWRNWDDLQLTPDRYYGNVMAINLFNYQYEMAKIGKKTDRNEWIVTPQRIDAFYEASTNAVNIPAGFLQPPYFYPGSDDAINFGAIGSFIGHEFTHAFDDEGSRFDGDGNLTDWWTPQDRQAFTARTARLVEQASAFAPIKDKPDLHVDGALTLGENMADLGGVSIAYDALLTALEKSPGGAMAIMSGYTPEQRFFMAWARNWRNNIRDRTREMALHSDPHAPPAFRANAPASNMTAFSTAFQCKVGDQMVRSGDQQVKIW